MKIKSILGLCLCLCEFFSCGPGGINEGMTAGSTDYQNLIKLFKEFREYQKPAIVDGVPDYTVIAMAEQVAWSKEFWEKFELIDSSSWTIQEKVDYEVLKAEILGLDFDHRIFHPWKRDPAFYAVITTSEPDVPAREGPEIFNVLYLFILPSNLKY